MKLALLLEQHDSECRRCGDPKPSSRECLTCGLEAANIGAAGEASVARLIDETERARDARRRANS